MAHRGKPTTPNRAGGGGFREAVRHPGIGAGQKFGPSYNVKTQIGINRSPARPGRNVNRLPIPDDVHDTNPFGVSHG